MLTSKAAASTSRPHCPTPRATSRRAIRAACTRTWPTLPGPCASTSGRWYKAQWFGIPPRFLNIGSWFSFAMCAMAKLQMSLAKVEMGEVKVGIVMTDVEMECNRRREMCD